MDVLVPVYSRYSKYCGYLPRYRYMDVAIMYFGYYGYLPRYRYMDVKVPVYSR